jgi:hypothetical protein
VIPREQNTHVDSLVVVASTLQPTDNLVLWEFKMEVVFRPLVPDNLEYWQVFHDDA